MIKKLSRQVSELNVNHKTQKKKLAEEFEEEKSKLVALFSEQTKTLSELHRTELEREKYKFNVVQVKLEDKMKEIEALQKKNNELEMVVTAPPTSGYCFSLFGPG